MTQFQMGALTLAVLAVALPLVGCAARRLADRVADKEIDR